MQFTVGSSAFLFFSHASHISQVKIGSHQQKKDFKNYQFWVLLLKPQNYGTKYFNFIRRSF